MPFKKILVSEPVYADIEIGPGYLPVWFANKKWCDNRCVLDKDKLLTSQNDRYSCQQSGCIKAIFFIPDGIPVKDVLDAMNELQKKHCDNNK